MFNRPRCRDWTALATQQLRLRNLIQISGHNIICDPNSTIYFTLHLTSMSAPCFTSEKLEYRKNMIWPEINCETILKSTSRCVCVRVWQHYSDTQYKENNIILNDSLPIQNADTALFLWGVYFSGLISISKRTDVKLKTNALVFYIHGGFFTSPDFLMPESIPRQLEIIGFHNNINAKQKQNLLLTESMLYHSNSSCSSSFKCDNNILVLKNNIESSSPETDTEEIEIESNNSNDSSCCIPNHINDKEKNANCLKVKYIEKDFFKSEIRISYDVKKLLLLQEKQRKIRYKTESAKELSDKICMRSAFCLNLELIANKANKYRPRNNTSMGRTLNRLLFQPAEQPKPEVLLKAQEIKRKIETAKFRCRLLLQEKNQGLINIRKLEKQLGEISDANTEQETWLMANYRGLGKDKIVNLEKNQLSNCQSELYDMILESLQQKRQQILRELKEIYLIKQNDRGMFTINDAVLPNAESYTDMTSPSDISVALGYSAHITLMCSVILDCPLRNAIIHKGSASRIVDNIKILRDQEREFPLFCRSNPPPDAFFYGVYLLNQNLSQLKFRLGLNKEDLRATLPNIMQLLNIFSKSQRNNTNLYIPKASVSESSSDINLIVPVNQLFSSNDKINKDDKRICRSVGSYPEDSCLNTNSNFTSEPILHKDSAKTSNNNRIRFA